MAINIDKIRFHDQPRQLKITNQSETHNSRFKEKPDSYKVNEEGANEG